MIRAETFDHVFQAIADSPEEAENLRLRADLMIRISDLIDERGLTQARAAKLFGVTQPRVSDLVRRHIDLFSVDTLIGMLARAGMQITLSVKPAA